MKTGDVVMYSLVMAIAYLREQWWMSMEQLFMLC
jgi:hypothetical protein